MRQTTLHPRIFAIFICFFSYSFSIQAQTPVSFCISSATDNGNGVTIAVTTENFTEIVSTQFTVIWNPDDLELISTGNFNSALELSESNFTPPSISNPVGLMGFSWLDIAGQTLPPGAILFSMTFAVNNSSTEVTIGNSLIPIEVTNTAQVFLDTDIKAGTVNATGGTLSGNIFNDGNSDCIFTSDEVGLENWIVKIESSQNTFFATSDESGNFSAFIPLGNYSVSIEEISTSWEACITTFNVDVTNPGVLVNVSYPVKPILDCPVLELNVSSSSLANCSSNNIYTIDYCNLGSAISTDSYIEISFDEYTTVVSSPVSFSTFGGNLYSFDVGDVEVGACNSFDIIVDISCDAPDGITHCVSAHMFPDNFCGPTDPLWSGASLKITGECNSTQDSVIFTVENKGVGNMIDNSVYIVIEDAVLFESPTPLEPLISNGTRIFSYPANGTTYRMEVDQVAFHPGMSMPSATVEGCVGSSGGTISTGLVNQFIQDEADAFVSIDCRENTGANVANNKEASPLGFGDQNFIEPNTPIEYLIHFQNTESDTLVDMTIRDTLSEFLNPATLRNITSSHYYEFEVTGEGVAVFKFPNINLASDANGFVKFKISQLPDLPLDTKIENTSAIHFGFNSPIVTNTVFHTVNENFISVKTEWVSIPNLAVNVYPNPSRDVVHFEVEGHDFESIELKLFDLRGSLIHSATSPNELFTFYRNDIPAGVYAFSLSSEGALLSTGKLVIK